MPGRKVALRLLPFSEVAALCSALLERLSRAQRAEAFRLWRADCVRFWNRVEERYIFSRDDAADSLFGLLRLIFPADDHRTYRMKEPSFRRLLLGALGKQQTAGASQLQPPALRRVDDFCPLARTVASLCAAKHAAGGGAALLTIGRVNAQLDALAAARGEHARAHRFNALLALFEHGRPSEGEAYWLTRCILKEALLGERPKLVLLDAFLEGTYRREYPLEQLCADALAPAAGPLGRFFRTAQPKRARTPLEAWRMFSRADPGGFCGEVLIETKVDGWRLQLHVAAGAAVRVFTHKGKVTSRLSGDYAAHFGRAAAKLAEALARSGGGGKGAIFDCEVVVVQRGRVEPFGGVGTLRHGGSDDGRHHCLVLFDLLASDGRLLINKPLRERRAELERLVTPIRDWVVLSDAQVARALPAPSDCPIARAMSLSIVRGQEGVVVKDLGASYYAPCMCVKLKACYITGMVDDMHLAILGANFGEGKNRARLGSFVLCARARGGFVPVCETSVGLNGAQLAMLDNLFWDEGKAMGAGEQLPAHCAGDWWAKHRPVRLLRDCEHGLLVDVLASALLRTGANREAGPGEPKVGGGYALRFPRIVRLRGEEAGSIQRAHAEDELHGLFLERAEHASSALGAATVGGAPPAPDSAAFRAEVERVRETMRTSDRAYADMMGFDLRAALLGLSKPPAPSPEASESPPGPPLQSWSERDEREAPSEEEASEEEASEEEGEEEEEAPLLQATKRLRRCPRGEAAPEFRAESWYRPVSDDLLRRAFGRCEVVLDPKSMAEGTRAELERQLLRRLGGVQVVNLSAEGLVPRLREPRAGASYVVVDSTKEQWWWLYHTVRWRGTALDEQRLWVFVDRRQLWAAMEAPEREWRERCEGAFMFCVLPDDAGASPAES